MDKLINLLNEFENEEADANIRYWNYYQNGFHLLEYGQTYSEMLIISKRYGFIEWLVENNKIDFSREGDLAIELVNLFERKLDNVEGVIALLSISNTPIDDLISYLK